MSRLPPGVGSFRALSVPSERCCIPLLDDGLQHVAEALVEVLGIMVLADADRTPSSDRPELAGVHPQHSIERRRQVGSGALRSTRTSRACACV